MADLKVAITNYNNDRFYAGDVFSVPNIPIEQTKFFKAAEERAREIHEMGTLVKLTAVQNGVDGYRYMHPKDIKYVTFEKVV